MPISVSTDPIRPAERTAYWTEAICRSFASVETKPLGSTAVSGHFEFVEIGDAKLVRFDSSPQCYTRNARLVNMAGSDEFMFDFQRRGRSSIVQAGNESTIEPGYGVLYDARRTFEDRLYGPEPRMRKTYPLVRDGCARDCRAGTPRDFRAGRAGKTKRA